MMWIVDSIKNFAILNPFLNQNKFSEFYNLQKLINDWYNSIKYTQYLVNAFYRTETGINKKSQKFIPFL